MSFKTFFITHFYILVNLKTSLSLLPFLLYWFISKHLHYCFYIFICFKTSSLPFSYTHDVLSILLQPASTFPLISWLSMTCYYMAALTTCNSNVLIHTLKDILQNFVECCFGLGCTQYTYVISCIYFISALLYMCTGSKPRRGFFF